MTKSVLVVDDNAHLAKNVGEILAEDGHHVVVETSPLEAWERASSLALGVALLDVRMPDLSGVELFLRLKSIHPEARYVLMTGYARAEEVQPALERGAELVVKPLPPDALRALVRRAMAACESKPPVTFVAVEDGAGLADVEDATEEVIVELQEGEPEEEFLARVVHRLHRVTRDGAQVRRAVFLVGEEDDVDVRPLLARALFTHLAQGEGGELELVAHLGSGAPLRHSLLELAGTLASEGNPHVSVRVKIASS